METAIERGKRNFGFDYDQDDIDPGGSDISSDDEQDTFIRVPSCMLGKPLKDFHSGQDNTFLAVGIKLGKQQVFRFSTSPAMYVLGSENFVRRVGIFILTHQYFEIGILLTIITNCVFMAINLDEKSKAGQSSEIIFAIIYTFEMFVKILARGFILHKYSYLRNAWNWLDFLVVIISYVTMHPEINSLSFFKTFRVLRALKTISTVKGLKAMVDTLFKSMKMMKDVAILTFFFIAVFALIGLQLFMGEFHKRCLKGGNKTLNEIYYAHGFEVVCATSNSTMGGWECPDGYQCESTKEINPEEGFISYDNITDSFLTTFQVVTLDSWEKVYNYGIAVKGTPIMFYFLLVVFLGPFYLLNLVLAIVSASYEMEINECPEEEIEAQAMHRRSASTYSFNGDTVAEYLTGVSPVVEIDGEKRYTVSDPPPKKKKKPKEDDVPENTVPVLTENPSVCLRIRMPFYNFANTSVFEYFIIFCIIVNTLIMATEYVGMDPWQEALSEYGNYVFTGVFIVEMWIKVMAYGPKGYVKNRWNCFDGSLVLISIVDLSIIIILPFFSEDSNTGSISELKMLKGFRLLRVLKLAQSWKTMAQLLSTIGSSLGALGNVSILLLLIIYIFSVAGMQLFNSFTPEHMKDDYFYPIVERWNFKDFPNSFMMIFRILCGKWIEPQWALSKKYNYFTLIFVMLVFIIGRWVLLNLFLALLLSSFGGDAFASDEEEAPNKPKVPRIKRLVRWLKGKKRRKKATVHAADETGLYNYNQNYQWRQDIHVNDLGSDSRFKPKTSTESIQLSLPTESSDIALDQEFAKKTKKKREKTYVEDCFCGFCYTCGCFYNSYLNSPSRRLWHNARFYCNQLVEHKMFEACILFLITFSSITLVFEDIHLKNNPGLVEFLQYCNYIFAIIFTLEFLVKLFAMGLIKYFTNFWNILDVFIVCISLATLLFDDEDIDLGFLRSLRGLRPLRAISRFAGMKVVVNALVHSIPSIGNVLLVSIMFWFLFSIMGYNMFGGTFGRCLYANRTRIHKSIVQNKTHCENLSSIYNYTWYNPNINFDDSLNGSLALFETATLEGWFEVQYDAQDSSKDDKFLQPDLNQNYWLAAGFIILFIVVGAFFILNLFIGVIIDNFNRLTQQYEDGVGIFLTPTQRNWVNTLKAASLRKPSRRIIRPKSKWRAKLFDLIHKKYFEFFIMCIILLNMISMMMTHHNESEDVTKALMILNYIFTTIFTVEAIVRLVAMRLEYFKSGMNVFDFITVVFSIAVIGMQLAKKRFPISPGLFRVIRVLRLGRLLRFFEAAKGIRKLLFTIIKSAPALQNIGTLIGLIVFIYAIIGMNLFQELPSSATITPVSNFRTWFQSVCLLFRIATAASWNYVLEEAMANKKYPKVLSIIYFVSYMIMINLIIINMYIAVILENFNQAQSQDEAGITEDDLEQYYVVWEEFDPKATQFIKYSQLPDFINALEPPLRVPAPNYHFLEKVNIPIKDKHLCHCLDIMTALIKRALGDSCGEVDDSDDLESVIAKLELKFQLIFPRRTKEQTVETTKERLLTENSAARIIQCVFRRNLLFEGIRLILTSRNMSLRAREKNLSTVERLIVNLWKRKDDDPEEEEDETEEGDEEDLEYENEIKIQIETPKLNES